MVRLAPLRREVLESLAQEILHHHALGRVIVAVDSDDVDAADAFGADLAGVLNRGGHSAFAARVADFINSRERRESWGAPTAESTYRNVYDYSALRRVLVEPFQLGGSTGFVAAHYDRAREQQFEPKWLTAPDDAVLVLSGEYLQRPELGDLWNYTLWIETVPPEEQDPLIAAARRLYSHDVKVRQAASAIIDVSDPDRPVRIFADSC